MISTVTVITLWSVIVFIAGALFGGYVWQKIVKNLK